MGSGRIGDGAPRFLFDVNSPYAYLAAARVDALLPVRPFWQPIAFGFLLRHSGRRPWSFSGNQQEHRDEIARRARDRGLPPVVYPERWPVDCYSLLPLRAVICAAWVGCERPVAMALFTEMFVHGRPLDGVERVVAVAVQAAPDLLSAARLTREVNSPAAKLELQQATEQAILEGVPGVPSVTVGRRVFWGDDQLQAAAAAL